MGLFLDVVIVVRAMSAVAEDVRGCFFLIRYGLGVTVFILRLC